MYFQWALNLYRVVLTMSSNNIWSTSKNKFYDFSYPVTTAMFVLLKLNCDKFVVATRSEKSSNLFSRVYSPLHLLKGCIHFKIDRKFILGMISSFFTVHIEILDSIFSQFQIFLQNFHRDVHSWHFFQHPNQSIRNPILLRLSCKRNYQKYWYHHNYMPNSNTRDIRHRF